MPSTTVVNLRREQFDVYIGRPSVFGNPFGMTAAVDRASCIEKFRVYFEAKVKADAEFRAAVVALKGKRLGCYCKPLDCHGDVYVEWLEREGA